MRLIDKDSLLELIKDLEVTYQEDLDRFKDEELTNPQRYRDTQRGRIEGIIDCYIDTYNVEEIEAIPNEWIKNYARHKASKGFTEIDCYWQSWEEDVLKMVADWEKENEERINT